MTTYQIVRITFGDPAGPCGRVIATGRTLDEALTHCWGPAACGVGWFDWFDAEEED